MNRRAVLLALGGTTVGAAGCLTGDPSGWDDEDGETPDDPPPPEGSVRAAFEEGVTRPECEIESETVEADIGEETRSFETAGTTPYPDPPSEFDAGSITAFVESFEEAYVTQDVLCDRTSENHILGVGYNVETSETFDWHEDVTTAFLLRAAGASSGLDRDGRLWEADLPVDGVVYAVDETGTARADFGEAGTLEEDEFESEAPDPLEAGDLVARFD